MLSWTETNAENIKKKRKEKDPGLECVSYSTVLYNFEPAMVIYNPYPNSPVLFTLIS